MNNKVSVDHSVHPTFELDSKVLFLGSCFADNISRKFTELGLSVSANPFGTLFNPNSICQLINSVIDDEDLTEHIFQNEDVWLNWKMNSKIHSLSKTDLVNEVNLIQSSLKSYLISCSHIVFTFGSAHYHELVSSSEIVTSCHKMPKELFKKGFVDLTQGVEFFQETLRKLNSINSNIKFLFTISPVRYLRDGLTESFKSKSRLREIVSVLELDSNCSYFPAYEIVIDELRDYSFFESDGVHPNKEAVDFVWKRFVELTFSNELVEYSEKRDALSRRINHRHMHEGSKSSLSFESKTKEMVDEFNLMYPNNVV